MDAGNSYEMYAVAASVIGGVSTLGGQGILLGTVVGAAIWGTLQNGLQFVGVVVALVVVLVGGVITFVGLRIGAASLVELLLREQSVDDVEQDVHVLVLIGNDALRGLQILRVAVSIAAVTVVLDSRHLILDSLRLLTGGSDNGIVVILRSSGGVGGLCADYGISTLGGVLDGLGGEELSTAGLVLLDGLGELFRGQNAISATSILGSIFLLHDFSSFESSCRITAINI